jgi:acid phosphatase
MKNVFIRTLPIVAALIFLSACRKDDSNFPQTLQKSSLAASNATMVKPRHIVIVIEENRSYSQIMGSDSAPYINSLAKDRHAVVFNASYGATHPSQPNYLALYSGSDQGVTTDRRPSNAPFITPNLGRQLLDAGRTFVTYSQGLPYAGYDGDTWGPYVRRHNPAANWIGRGINQIPLKTNQPFTAFPRDYSQLPTVCFVIPNTTYDMHDGSVKEGDKWLKEHLDSYIQWTKTHDDLFILTFDEDNGKDSNHVFTMFYGSMVRNGVDAFKVSHYRLLRTIEDMYGLPYAGLAANAKTISNCWR